MLNSLAGYFAPPTTSLYQFLALGGLVVFLFLKAWRDLLEKTVSKTIIRLCERVADNDVEITRENAIETNRRKSLEDLNRKMALANEEMVRFREETSSSVEPDTESYRTRAQALIDNADCLSAKHRENEAEMQASIQQAAVRSALTEKLKIYIREAEEEQAKLNSVASKDKWMSWIALFISVMGFLLWYFKIQQYQDAILIHQALKKP
jgi:hypothetical protein